jgi:phosphatidylinositol kinase/protein kinase (PI-3  family)
MINAAVTWYERALQQLQDAADHEERNSDPQMMTSLKRLIGIAQHPFCAMHYEFCKSYGAAIRKLDELIIKWEEEPNSALRRSIKAIALDLNGKIDADVQRVRYIKLSAISEDLVEKRDFMLAVPGTYAPDRPVIRIAHFVGQFSVYLTKQSPKNIVMRGTDGVFYQYLLKGHEDLRLDERIMQFFRLINSYTKKQITHQSHLIQTMAVIPLSPLRGLVQWVNSTDTLRAIIEQYRTLHGREPTAEFPLLPEFALPRYDALLPIHKMIVCEKVNQALPDTDLANFFWLKAPNAEVWVNQITTFAISNGVSSIVGYLIGLGDRHPANLLIDRFTGKVIHIDFGDCFENLRFRENLPEVVPFRLTRMMVRAMGVAGVGGNFRSSFVNMSHLLRANKQVLLMLLAIFVQEPLVIPQAAYDMSGLQPSTSQDYGFRRSVSKAVMASGFDDGRLHHSEDSPPDDAAVSNEEIRKRVRSKLEGTDFDPDVVLSVEEQADRLIEEAMDPYNLAVMYHGWLPFW